MSDGAETIQAGPATKEQIAIWIERLSRPVRRVRQDAAHELGLIASEQPHDLEPYVENLVEALFYKEAQTRWEILNALTFIEFSDDALIERAIEGAEESLFDEISSTLRLAAFRLLSKLGAAGPAYSDETWPLLNEAIQCFHGDPEYRDMLVALVVFASGDISDATRKALIKRISFDAVNGHGYIMSWSKQVVAAAKEGAK